MDKHVVEQLEKAGIDTCMEREFPVIPVRLSDAGKPIPVGDEVAVQSGKKTVLVRLKSISRLFTGSAQPPSFAKGPTHEYVFFFALIERLADLLDESAVGSGDDEAAEEGPFEIAKVERGRLWLVGDLGGREYGAVPVPEEASRRAKVGWTISGVLSRDGREWRFAEVWNVYPR